tara:strand:- start:4928 stop:5692 length:765 start_codon:yes stop_codon:yes gene_type:complete
MNIKEIFNSININKGDKILVNSSILKILIECKKIDKKFNPNQIIDTIVDKIGKTGTLLLPTYNWDFCRGLRFDYFNSKSQSGSLGNISLKRKDFKRSKNPIYSFSIFGNNKDHICKMPHDSCFGLESPFGYLIKNKGKNLFIDIDYKDAFTFVHVAEEFIGVDYRYLKDFKGNYKNELNQETEGHYKMYVRDLKKVRSTIIDKGFDKVLIKNNAYEKKIIEGINFTMIDISKAYNLMVNELKHANALIYPDKIK